jgi:hypothetical protein
VKQKLDMALVEVNNNDVKSNKDEGFLSLPYKVPMCVKISSCRLLTSSVVNVHLSGSSFFKK